MLDLISDVCHRGVNFAPVASVVSFRIVSFTKRPFEVANLGKSQRIEVSQGIGDANHLLGGIKPRRDAAGRDVAMSFAQSVYNACKQKKHGLVT